MTTRTPVNLVTGFLGAGKTSTILSLLAGKPAGETWSGTNVASGTASFYRLVLPADTGAASTSAPRVQGTVGVIDANMNLSSVGLVNAAPQGLTSYTVSLLGG